MKYHVQRRWSLLGGALLLVCVGLLYVICFSSLAQEAYQEVLARANPAAALDDAKGFQAKQLRKGIQKNFWYKKGDQPLEVIILADTAEMVFEKQGAEQQIVEHMTGVKCYIQEALYESTQQVRYLEADTAKYHYTTETLEAEQVKMALFMALGSRLDTVAEQGKPVMDGFAERVEVTMVDKTLNFKTNKFRGSFSP